MSPRQIATGLIEGLKGQPLLLALVVVNCAFLFVVYNAITAERAQEHQVMQLLLERCIGKT